MLLTALPPFTSPVALTPCVPWQIILSTGDSIVPVEPVSRYLHAKQLEGFGCFELLHFRGLHGEMMLHARWVATISQKVNERCSVAVGKTGMVSYLAS
jgi:hypothetical protein